MGKNWQIRELLRKVDLVSWYGRKQLQVRLNCGLDIWGINLENSSLLPGRNWRFRLELPNLEQIESSEPALHKLTDLY